MENQPQNYHYKVMSFDTNGFTGRKLSRTSNSLTCSKHRKQPYKVATANLCLTAFQRERIYLEFDKKYPIQVNSDVSPIPGILTIINPSEDTPYIVTFDDHRSDNAIDVIPKSIEVPANGRAEASVTYKPTKEGDFRSKLYFKTSSRLRLEVVVTGKAVNEGVESTAAKQSASNIRSSKNNKRASIPHHAPHIKSKKILTTFHNVPGENKAPLDPKLKKILQSCGQLGVPVVASKKVTQPVAFELSSSRRTSSAINDVPKEREKIKKIKKHRRAPSAPSVTISRAHTIPSTTVTKVKQKKKKHVTTATTSAAATTTTTTSILPSKTLRLSRKAKTTNYVPPAGSTNARRTNAVIRSRHTQLRRVLYDENWTEKQSVGFTAYLNATFYPAEDAISSADTGKYATDLTAPGGGAPAQPNDYFRTLLQTQRQASIRRRAFRIYQSRDMDHVCFNIDKEVASGGMAIREDRDLYADLGLRKRVMDLMFCYHPVWLRLGLETVFGEIIPMRASSVHDAGQSVLKRFMKERLLQDPDTATKFKPTKAGTFGEGYIKQLSKLTLRRFLMVVLFLDRAKQMTEPETIEGGPCLFRKSSPFKSSREIVVSFAKYFLSGEGDVNRHLCLLGYDVTYKQSKLDEIDYTIHELSTELRDGVRLCRLVEVLSSRNSNTIDKENRSSSCKNRKLSSQLRMPAGSRLQKKHNVALALTALKKEGVSMSGLVGRGMRGDITTDDIVNGHCEKTLALLWRTIAHYRLDSGNLVPLSLLMDEIVRVRAAHSKQAHEFEQAQIYAEDADKAEDMIGSNNDEGDQSLLSTSPTARALLKWTRAVCAGSSLRVPIRNFTTSFADGRALCALLNFYHPQLLSTGDMQTTTTDLAIQRGSQNKKTNSGKMSSLSTSMFSSTWSADLLSSGDISSKEYQRCLEGERGNFELFNKSIQLIGSVPNMLGEHDSDHLPEEKVMVIVLAHVCARVLQSSKEIHACLRIQAYWRKVMKFRTAQIMNRAAIIIARIFGHVCRKNKFHKFRSAIVKMQAIVRQRIARQRYMKVQNITLSIQSHFRRHSASQFYENERISNIVLKACSTRAHKMRQQYYGRKRISAATTLCAFGRCVYQRSVYQRVQLSTLVIQKNVRRSIEHNRLTTIRNSIISIQSIYRGSVARNILYLSVQAAINIQRYWRMKRAMNFKNNVLRAVVSLQCAFRVSMAKKDIVKRIRQRYEGEISAATVVQSVYRSYAVRQQQAQMHDSALRIQSFVRKKEAVYKYQVFRKSVIFCQSLSRRNAACSTFFSFKNAVISLQCMTRSYLAKRNLQLRATEWNTYQNKSSIVIQSCFRRYSCMKMFNDNIQACTKIQSYIRMFQAVKKFQSIVNSATIIQSVARRFRATVSFETIKFATITIQSSWRCYKMKTNFQQITEAVVTIQSLVRCVQTRSKYVKVLQSIINIQCATRMFISKCILSIFKQKRNEREISNATKLQTCFRRYSCMKMFNDNIQACTKIQSYIRMFQAVKKFQSIVNSATIIQSVARRFRATVSFETIKFATITIQSSWRCYKMKTNFQQITEAVVTIQSLVRCVQTRSKFVKVLQSIINIQCATRCYLSRQDRNALRKKRDLCYNSATSIAAFFRGYLARKDFVSSQAAVISIQSFFRCQYAQNNFCSFVIAIKVVQSQFRGQTVRRNIIRKHQHASRVQASIRRHLSRQNFIRAKQAAVCIQCARRCIVSRRTYVLIRSTVIVQKSARKWIAMAIFAKTRRASVLIQSHARRFAIHRNHCCKRFVSMCIARLHRARFQRKKYLKYRSAMVSLQTCYRHLYACKVLNRMKQEAAYSIAQRRAMEKSATKIQIAYKMFVAYKKRKCAAIVLQEYIRNFLKRLRTYRIQKSIGFVQAFWRGCIARSRSSKALINMKLRVQSANENASDDMKLGNRTSCALQILLKSKALSEVFEAIKTLEVSTRLSSVCCSCFAQEVDAIPIIYGLMRSCNRSQPHRKLLLHALRVLNNVWPYEMKIARGNESNIAPAFEPRMEILLDLMQMFRDKLSTFKLACRLARWLCADPERSLKAKSNKDTMKRLKSIHSVLARKAKMISTSQHRNGKSSKKCPATEAAVAIASLIHTINDNQ